MSCEIKKNYFQHCGFLLVLTSDSQVSMLSLELTSITASVLHSLVIHSLEMIYLTREPHLHDFVVLFALSIIIYYYSYLRQILLNWFYLSGKSSLIKSFFFVLSIIVIDITFRLSSFSSHGSKRPCGTKKSPSFVRWLFKHLLLNFKGFVWIFVLFKSWSSTGKDTMLIKSLLSFTRLSNIWASSTSNDGRWRRGNRGWRLSKIIFVPTTWRKLYLVLLNLHSKGFFVTDWPYSRIRIQMLT